MNGEIRRRFVCCRCDAAIVKRATIGYSLNVDMPSKEAERIFKAGSLGRVRCPECGGTMHPDQRTAERLAEYSFGVGSATVI